MCIELYPYNEETFNRIMSMWEITSKVATIQPTGTGKSFLILKCAETFNDKNKVVVAPSNYILEQLELTANGNIDNIKYITYATLQNMTDEELQELNADIIMLDEFHRCGAKKWGEGVKQLIDIFPNAKTLGTSATPIRYLDNERDMSDELFDGNIACNLTLPQALAQKILPMPKYVSALYTYEEESNNMIEKVNKSSNSDEEKQLLIKDIQKLKNRLDKSKGIPKILNKYIDNPNGKYIVFCKNKNHMEEMVSTVMDWFSKYFALSKNEGEIHAYKVLSEDYESDKKFNMFVEDNSENALKLMFCVNMLNEGLHIKNVNGVILLRTTTSPIIYYQQIGRAIDAGQKEKPLILDFVNNFDNVKINSFKSELDICLRETFREFNGDNTEGLDEYISRFQIYDESCDAIELFNGIEDILKDSFDNNFELLKKHCQEIGGFSFSENTSTESKKMRSFVKYIRDGSIVLDDERIEKLKSINFVFDALDEKWNKKFFKCEKYLKKNGSLSVPRKYKQNGVEIGTWLCRQKSEWRKGNLTDDKISRLEKLGLSSDIIKPEKRVEIFDFNGNSLGIYRIIKELILNFYLKNGIKFNDSSIRRVCEEKQNSHKGYKFRYVEEPKTKSQSEKEIHNVDIKKEV